MDLEYSENSKMHHSPTQSIILVDKRFKTHNGVVVGLTLVPFFPDTLVEALAGNGLVLTVLTSEVEPRPFSLRNCSGNAGVHRVAWSKGAVEPIRHDNKGVHIHKKLLLFMI